MLLRWLMASLHILALPLGITALWVRAHALRRADGADGLRLMFLADNWWGLAALLWLGTGLVRLLDGLEKPAAYYGHDRAFFAKMALLALILLLEIRPMMTLIRWRIGRRRGLPPDLSAAPALARICWLQMFLVVLMVLAATAVARGFFY